MIHETAIVSDKADIDASVSVGPYCIIDENVNMFEIKENEKIEMLENGYKII